MELGHAVQRNRIAQAAVLLVLVLFFACAIALFPAVFQRNIAEKNDPFVHFIPIEEMSAYAEQFQSSLPLIYLSCEDEAALCLDWTSGFPPRVPTATAAYVFDSGAINSLADRPSEYYPLTTLRPRGRSSSFHGDKKPFALELLRESKADPTVLEPINQPFFGFPPESDFVLYAPFIDKSCMRNYMAYTMAAEILDYTPRCAFAEVFTNQAGTAIRAEDYRGIYLVVEKIKQGRNRLPIGKFIVEDNLNAQLTHGGGYIVKRDFHEGHDTEKPFPLTPANDQLYNVYPRPETITEKEMNAIYEELVFFEDLMLHGSFADIERYIDVESFVNMTLLNAYTYNLDAFVASTYFYRLPGGKFSIGPAWDYDISMGQFLNNSSTPSLSKPVFVFNDQYIQSLLARPEFKARLIARWRELRAPGGTFDDSHVTEIFDQAVCLIGPEAFLRNAERYPRMFDGSHVFANSKSFTNYRDELNYVHGFLLERGAWLDANMAKI